jgi:hypothetical protein
MKTRRTTPRWVERQIDEALLMISMQTAFLYAHRRARRVLPKVAVGAAVATGVSAAAAATVAGLGVVGVAGGAAAWYRHSKRSAAAAPQPAAPAWRPPAVCGHRVRESHGVRVLAHRLGPGYQAP